MHTSNQEVTSLASHSRNQEDTSLAIHSCPATKMSLQSQLLSMIFCAPCHQATIPCHQDTYTLGNEDQKQDLDDQEQVGRVPVLVALVVQEATQRACIYKYRYEHRQPKTHKLHTVHAVANLNTPTQHQPQHTHASSLTQNHTPSPKNIQHHNTTRHNHTPKHKDSTMKISLLSCAEASGDWSQW